MMLTVGGTAVVSGITAFIPAGLGAVSNSLLVLVRSFGGLGFSEQAVNATYMNEVYQVTEDERKRKRPGFHYSFIQGGWPLGFLLASALALVFLPLLGWRALYLMATIPAIIIVLLISKKLKETPQFELHKRLTELEKGGKSDEAHALAGAYGVEHSSTSPLKRIWEGEFRRNTIVFSLAWTLAVFDYGLFGTLLPAMQEEFGWTAPEAYAVNTWIAVGTAIVCFGVGPVIDRLGRKKGMMLTVGGTAVVSGVTAFIPAGLGVISNSLLVFVRSFGGLGFSEQAVNAT
jgi:MFS family permease